MAVVRKGIAEILLEKKYVTQAQYDQAREAQVANNGDIGKIFMDLGFASERDIVQSRAESEGIPFLDLTKHKPESNALNVVPEHIVRKHNAIPVKKDGQRLWVAMANPRNIMAVDDIKIISRCQVVPMAAVPGDIADAISKSYTASASTNSSSGPPGAGQISTLQKEAQSDMLSAIKDLQVARGSAVDSDDDEDGSKGAEAAPIIRVANSIITQAVEQGASDIHIEPDRRNTRVRYRVDGVLHEATMLPRHIQNSLISRYKIMSDMNIAEKRVPQDGRIPIKVGNKDYDLRVSCLPSMYGEKIVMRILDKSSTTIGLDKLGFMPDVQSVLEELTVQPNGMVLVTGPTGSGKTTTLYSVLHKINSIDKNIITVEDPIEYQLSGVTQVGVNKKAGLVFSTALRSFLRQDPDIIMVGEMRDLETADIAIEAALTGHLVLSTLHTNDAPSATMRLVDMGVEPFLIAATLIGILAQRLARKICKNCKEPYEVRGSELLRFGFKPEDPNAMVTLYRGKGCDECRSTGYRGRTGIHEMLTMNTEISELVVRRAPVTDIKAAAIAGGMKEMRVDGLRKILDGTTTPEEVMRVVFTAGY